MKFKAKDLLEQRRLVRAARDKAVKAEKKFDDHGDSYVRFMETDFNEMLSLLNDYDMLLHAMLDCAEVNI